MKNYNDWALLVAKNLQGEADLIAAIDKDELDDDAARLAFISAVLEPFLPQSYAIGSGRVVDAHGNYSDHLDIVIYHRDYPRIGLKSTHAVYLYESVLAAFEIRGKLLRKSLLDAMDSCASLAKLTPSIDQTIYKTLAEKKGMKPGQHGEYEHSDPMQSQRFGLIARPPTFVFGFTGIKNSHKQLSESIEVWLQHCYQSGSAVTLKDLPAVIATQGCFAWRNSAPLALKPNKLMGVGNDSAPVRLIIMQLMHLLSRRLSHTINSFGFKQNLQSYLKEIEPPVFEATIGELDGQPAQLTAKPPVQSDKPQVANSDNQPAAAAAPTPAPAEPKPAAQQVQAAEAPAASKPPEPAAPAQETAADADFSNASFNKPRKAPSPAPEPVSEAAPAEDPAKPKMKTLNSAVPSMSAEPAEETSKPMKSLDSAVPSMSAEPQGSAASDVPEFIADESFPEGEQQEEPVMPNTPSMAGELEFPKLEDPDENKEEEFEQTLVMQKPMLDENQSATETPAPATEAPAPASQPAQAADTESSDSESAEGEFEQTLVLQAPPAQEAPKVNGHDGASDEIKARMQAQPETTEPFPHLAPKKKEEADPFTSTIPQ